MRRHVVVQHCLRDHEVALTQRKPFANLPDGIPVGDGGAISTAMPCRAIPSSGAGDALGVIPMANSLIDVGKLSKPATVLIEKVSDGTGGIFKPWMIRRVARAEADADIIRAQTRIKISEMEERALVRMLREEGKKQENIESITAQAIPLLSTDAKPEDMEADWVTHVFDKCRLISDADMQSLWARILAGEANQRGSFSKRTVDLAASLDKVDAELFTSFCSFVWLFGNTATPIIYNSRSPTLSRAGIFFGTLNHLDDIGLITYSSDALNLNLEKLPKRVTVSYFGQQVIIDLPSDSNDMLVGRAMLTLAGRQLATICTGKWSDEYFREVLGHWMNQGYALWSPITMRDT
jgi:Protein of unknown function (DUF2806)